MSSVKEIEKQLQNYKLALFLLVLFVIVITAGVMVLSKQVTNTKAENPSSYATEDLIE